MSERNDVFEAALHTIGPKVRAVLDTAFMKGEGAIKLTMCAIDLNVADDDRGGDYLVLDPKQALTMISCLWADGFTAGVEFAKAEAARAQRAC